MPMPNSVVFPDMGNAYVEDMTHHAHLDNTNEYSILIENPAVDNSALIALAAYTAGEKKAMKVTLPEVYGRTILMNNSVASVMHITGFDYLGQPMYETITVAVGGTPVQGKKAFKVITQIQAITAGNVTVTTGQAFGLPLAGVELVRELVDGVTATEGTLTAAPVVAQTATTDDPRGVYNPNAATDGVKDISLTIVTAPNITGGLYGRRHFSA